MLCTNQDLIKISNISKRTFYRRLNDYKEKHELKRVKGYFYNSNTAYSIAQFMGFEDSFKIYFIKQLKNISV